MPRASARSLVTLLERAEGSPTSGLRFLDRRERPSFYDWSAIRREAQRVAAGLQALGIRPGDRVALIHPTSVDLIHGLFGVLWAGAVPVPLYPPVRLGRLDEYHPRTATMLGAAGARLALVDSRVAKLLGKTCELAGLEKGFLTVGQVAVDGAPPAAEVGPSDPALVQFSSGTTVEPKPVCLSHGAIVAQVEALNSFWGSDPKPTGVSWLPLYHDMGLIGCIFPALDLQSVMTLIGPEVFVAKPALWLRAVSRWRASISVAPNFAYGLCVDKIRDEELEGVDLSCWKVALNGAEPVAPEVLRAFQERFARWGFPAEALTPVYGLSEATLAVTFSDLHRPFTAVRFDRTALLRGEASPHPDGCELISVGRPLPGTEVRIESDADTGSSPIGRILVRGPSVMDGYLDRPEATAAAIRDGWLDTGDLGFFHDGELFVHGRAKDVLILRGRNHSPVDVEQAVDGLPGVRIGCAVAASHRPEGADGEKLYLFLESGGDATPAEIEALPEACGEAVVVACGLRLDHVQVVAPGTLPRTSSGKLRRGETLERFLSGTLSAPTRVGPVALAGAMAGSALAYRRNRRRKKTDGG